MAVTVSTGLSLYPRRVLLYCEHYVWNCQLALPDLEVGALTSGNGALTSGEKFLTSGKGGRLGIVRL